MNLKIALAQINPTVGDLDNNGKKIIQNLREAKKQGADLAVFPELAITGYPPKDLLLRPSFIRKNMEVLEGIKKETRGISCIVGFVYMGKDGLFNSAALVSDREIVGIQHKSHLPNYDVFDEKRYFSKAPKCHVFNLKGTKIGINICEDIWSDNGPTELQVRGGAELIINISASPFHAGKIKERENLLSKRARENHIFVAYVNLVGGQDDLVFDGGSYLFNRRGELSARCRRFEEDLVVTELNGATAESPPLRKDTVEEIFSALVLGTRDYVRKNGFEKVVVGISGGVDSALTASIASKALGPKNVLGIFMPGVVTSKESREDAQLLSENLGIEYKVIPINDAVSAFARMLKEEFKDKKPDVTEENIQARIRGNILMAISNKLGHLVLSTGNKSETAVGYTTLYGDMAGGIAVISDVPKTTVYKLARRVKQIPKSIIEKEPSAELREGQKDTDTLPPYDVLDPILNAYIEENKSSEDIIARGFDPKVVEDIIHRVDSNEYKRQQSAPGIRITPKAFGTGRRMPITHRHGR
ncbi:MAG: NAD+ synthase [Candidatus Hydrothermarchaeaceae archaeon]